MQRRTFVIGAIAGGVGLVQYVLVSRYMNRLREPRGFSVREYLGFGEKAALVAITPNEDFFVQSKGEVPTIRAGEWHLRIDGLVEEALTITYADLLGWPRIDKLLTLECINNPIGGTYIGNARWSGTPLQPLLEGVRPTREAVNAILYGADGYTTGLPVERLLNPENFLAYRMNGEDLSPAHGYPCRIFVPGKYGQKQPKWLTRIELVNREFLGYWETRGWSDDAECWAHARFTDLEDGAKISGKNFVITGYAQGNLDGIQTVEISFDGGKAWEKTSLFSNPPPPTWSFWKYVWVAPRAGRYRLTVRATDRRGRIQEPEPQSFFPGGATGQQNLEVIVE